MYHQDALQKSNDDDVDDDDDDDDDDDEHCYSNTDATDATIDIIYNTIYGCVYVKK